MDLSRKLCLWIGTVALTSLPCSAGQLEDSLAPYRLPPTGDPALPDPFVGDYVDDGDAPPPDLWWRPYDWLRPVTWDGSVEAGINGTDGNAEALSMRLGAAVKLTTELQEIGARLVYAKATADGAETQHDALLDVGYERFPGDTNWTYFAKFGLEYDEFKAFDLRLSLNGGVGYYLLQSEHTSWKARFGAGVSREVDSPDERWKPEALFGTDYEAQLSEQQKLVVAIDYFPTWEDFTDYRLISELAWEVLLDADRDLSLKLSVSDRYDSTPSGHRPNDVDYALLLLWKL